MKELLGRYISGIMLGELTQHKNLAVVSLLCREQPERDYLVLEEALSGGLKIMEQQRPNVPEVDVENATGKDVLIIFGEYLLGGGQNRQVAANVYLEKGFKGKLPVKCVQHGRWNPSSGKEFRNYGGYATTTTRISTRAKRDAQGTVWGSIEDIAERTHTHSGTSDLSEIYEKQKEGLEEYTSKFVRLPNQVGLVAAIGLNGKKMLAADLFDSSKTLEKHYSALIKSHALEALGRPVDKVSVSKEEIMDFLTDIMKANPEQPKEISLGTDYTLTSRDGAEGTTLINANRVRYASMTKVI